jgi:hypothetical protein
VSIFDLETSCLFSSSGQEPHHKTSHFDRPSSVQDVHPLRLVAVGPVITLKLALGDDPSRSDDGLEGVGKIDEEDTIAW